MPNATIYIRKADYKKWQSIKDKPAFISEALKTLNVTYLNEHPEYFDEPEDTTQLRST